MGKPQISKCHILSYDIYIMLSFQNLEKLLQTLLPKNNGKFKQWLFLYAIKPYYGICLLNNLRELKVTSLLFLSN